MPDPADPQPIPGSADIPPPPPPPPSGPEVNASTLDLPSNIAAALACIPLVGGIVFYLLEKRNGFVRFYAMQSIIFGGAWFLFGIVYAVARTILTPIPAIGVLFALLLWIIWALGGIAFLVVWILATVKAFTNVLW